jgi:hypothetical protein
LKTVFTYLLVIGFFTHTVWQSAIYLHFEWRRAEIAATLCEKRFELESDCKGSCYLMKELKEAEAQNESQTPDLQRKELNLIQNLSHLSLSSLPNINSSTLIIPQNLCLILSGHLRDVFRPPACTS